MKTICNRFILLLLLMMQWLTLADASAQAPTNDNFANRIILSGSSVTTTGTNTNATSETGEPFNWSGRNSVWWAWTAPVSGSIIIRTTGSSFDTTLGIFTGTAVNALNQIVVNDDANGTLESQVDFNATAGVQYQIQVSSYSGQSGSISLIIGAGTVSAPTITTQPSSPSILAGNTATLSVVASGTAPLTYQWYQGAVGTTTTPVGTNSASFTTPALSATTTYWVRVSNSAGAVNSNLATVTVTQPVVAPTITTQPSSPSILAGNTATLSVVASGSTPLTYQWYQGAVGTTTTPVGTNSASFTTPALSATTTYWVRVSNSAGAVNSNLATVTVTQPVVAPTITTQPSSPSILAGNTATLSVVASGSTPLTYQWYQGAVGTTTTPVGTNSASFTTPALSATTTYWVRVSNSAGAVNSNLATVTVTQPVVAPTITTQPSSPSILAGNTATLSVLASGSTPLTYQWYQGAVGTTTTPVGTNSASFTTPALSASTTYWVRVSNSAGAVNSNLATVTVTQPVVAPTITTQPSSPSILAGNTATLSVLASGSTPLTYQWYQGAVGTTTTPVGTNSASFTTPALSATTTYWVRVSNSAGAVNSNLATVRIAVPVNIPDPALLAALRTALAKPTGDITEADLLTLTNLRLAGLGITNLSGLEKATNLRILDIRRNNFSDAAALWAVLDQITPMYCLYVDVRRPGSNPPGLIVETLTDATGTPFFIFVDAPNLPTLDFSSLNVDTSNPSNLTSLQVISSAGVAVETGGTNLPPFAAADFTVVNATTREVQLSGTASGDIDGSLTGYSWSWTGGSASGATATATLPYGDTPVTLTVTDDDGATGSTTITVRVERPYEVPTVTNLTASQRVDTRLVDIRFDVAAVTPTVTTALRISNDSGATFTIPATTLSGDIGANVAVGSGKTITWDAGADWPEQFSATMRFEVSADDGLVAPSITTQPASITIGFASTTTLSVAASGTSPLTYQWYRGALGVTTTPVGTNSATFTTPELTTTTSYWVRVSNPAGGVNSALATVTVVPLPSGMELIPAGTFTMGRTSGDTDTDAVAATMTVSEFYLGRHEVTKALWDQVRSWAVLNGYTDLAVGEGKAANHPVQTLTWWDAVKWCNARSEQEGLIPCYTVGGAVMRTGTTAPVCDWTASGYRLPTEAEWERAARGGIAGRRYPWGTDTISHTQANYYASTFYSYDVSPTQGYPQQHAVGTAPYTAPVGSYPANGYGLFDMAGNVWEWCWDYYGAYQSGSVNPRGPATGPNRIGRGGSWYSYAISNRVSHRGNDLPGNAYNDTGMRLARSVVSGTAPRVTTQPGSPTINSGSTATLSVVASGSTPLTYQWYQGAVGTTTTPVGTNSASFTTPALSATTTYWVRVSNSVGVVNSNLATVTVTPPVVAPTITTQPGSPTINSGSTATLSVVASGSMPLTYQWYQGAVGTTTTPVGTNSASFTTPALSATTTYWVRVSNSVGAVNSNLATVTVGSGAPADFALIPAGAFQMGRTSGDTDSDAPSVSVTVSAFFMGRYEVTKAEWDAVRTWGLANGYTDLAAGGGKGSNHPVHTISWFDMVKWCNARSERDGLTPVYTVSGAVMKTGTSVPTPNWSANGYRLPTEAEWEKAARGGVSGMRFPSGSDTISHSEANYYASSGYSYDLSGAVNNYHPTYATGSLPYSSPVGSFAPNGYGLYDMAGNMWECCWDWYGASTYVNGATDPRGAASGSVRVLRGGSWFYYANGCRAANRYSTSPSNTNFDFGFRVARSSVP